MAYSGSQTEVWEPEYAITDFIEQTLKVYVNILSHYTINRERCHFKMDFKMSGDS